VGALDTLALIVEHEAGKLLTRSQQAGALLQGEDLDALEILARCAKHLRAPSDASAARGQMTVEEALEAVGG
jgi:hypothetical protein